MTRRINNLLLFVASAADFAVNKNEVAEVSDLLVGGKTPLIQIQVEQKDIQPSRTCSEDYTFSATVLCRGLSFDIRCIWGVLTGLGSIFTHSP